MKTWRGLAIGVSLALALGLPLGACADDSGDGGNGDPGPGIGEGAQPKLDLTANGAPVTLTANLDGATVIGVNVSTFCDPETDEDCDLALPEYNEQVATSINLRNSGNAPLKVTELSIESTPPGIFELRTQAGSPGLPTSGDPILIEPLGTQDAITTYWVDVVVHRPEEGVSPTAVIELRTNSSINGGETVKIKVESEGLQPQIQAPLQVDFGNTSQGDEKFQKIDILNTGSGTLEITKFVLSGHPAFSFRIDAADWSEEWPVTAESSSEGITLPTPLIIEPGNSKQATIRFVPQGPEPASANLILMSNDPNAKSGWLIKISGNQTGPCVSINPKKVDFGGKLIGKLATVGVEVLSCGEAPLSLKSIRLAGTTSGDFSLELGGLPGMEMGTTEFLADETPCQSSEDCALGTCYEGSCAVVLDINESATFQVQFVPDEINPLDICPGDHCNEGNGQPIPDLGTIEITTDAFVSELDVDVRGFGVEVECPTAVIIVQEGEEVIPQTKLHLIGSQSYAASGGIAKYEWTVLQPVGSQSIFLPSSAAPDPTFEVNVAGTYVFTLNVWDEVDEPSCVPATYTVYVNPDEAIHVELLWDTPNDPNQTDEGPEAGADLDLHFLHPFATGQDVDGDGKLDGWFDQPFDCFWFNAHPNWGSLDPMVDDDPGLDRDDTDGAGPENVNLNIPEDGLTYRVGVHYWNDHGFGPSLATVRVYIYSSLVFTIADVELVNHDLWEVAEVHWPSGQVDPVLGDGGTYKIVPNYQHPYFFE